MIDVTKLPFDSEAMLAGLKPWILCESPTYDAQAVNRMMDMASRDLVSCGADVSRMSGRMGFGDCIRASFPHASQEPGILVIGHFDTVHPVGTLDKLPWRRDGNKCYGPGIMDMKGGNYAALEAMRQLARANVKTPLPVTFLFTSDEEIGSASTREMIEEEAAKHKYVLVPEPARSEGGVVTGRYAIARFNLEAIGRPSHAGALLADGRSAIRIMADMIPQIDAMTSSDCTFSVGVVHGGQWVNCVASSCTGQALSMAKKQSDLDEGVRRMLALSRKDPHGGEFIVTRGVTRPVWEPNDKTMALFESAKRIAATLGVDLKHSSAGGGSDGNFTGSMGIATLDGLGVRGEGLHTLNEFIFVESLAERGRLMAGLLAELI